MSYLDKYFDEGEPIFHGIDWTKYMKVKISEVTGYLDFMYEIYNNNRGADTGAMHGLGFAFGS